MPVRNFNESGTEWFTQMIPLCKTRKTIVGKIVTLRQRLI